jgi:hypothetical protein
MAAEAAPENVALHLISADGDYESELYTSQPKDYLAREWSEKKKSTLRLHKSLLNFFQECFPDFKLADEVEKVIAIQNLVQSFSFADTHKAIQKLQEHTEFSDEQLTKLLDAIDENTQIAWILSDEDVMHFAENLIALAKSKEAIAPGALVQARLDKNAEKSKSITTAFGGDTPPPF